MKGYPMTSCDIWHRTVDPLWVWLNVSPILKHELHASVAPDEVKGAQLVTQEESATGNERIATWECHGFYMTHPCERFYWENWFDPLKYYNLGSGRDVGSSQV